MNSENKNKKKTIAPEMAKVLKGVWDSLTDEQKEKVKACKSLDEIAACLGELGVALPDELLDKAAGGGNDIFDDACFYGLSRATMTCDICGAVIVGNHTEVTRLWLEHILKH